MTTKLCLTYTPKDGFAGNDALFYKHKVLHDDLGAAAVHSIYLNVVVSLQLRWILQIHVR